MAANNPSEFIDPIIQAMIATARNNREIEAQKTNNASLAEKTRASKAEEAWRQHQQDIQQSQFEKELELRQHANDLALKHYNLQAEMQHFGNMLGLGKAVKNREIDPTAAASMLPVTENPIIQQSPFVNPDVADAKARLLKAGEAEDQRKAQEGMLQFQNQLPPSQTVQAQLKNSRDIAGMNIEGRQEGKQTDYDKALAIATLKLGAAGQGSQIDDDAAQQYIDGVFINGNMKLNSIPQKFRNNVLAAGKKAGYTTPIDPKDSDAINGIPIMQAFIEKAKQLAVKGSGISGKLGVMTGMGEAGNLKGEVDALLGNIARVYGGEKGVLTQRDIERAKGAVYSLSQGQTGNLSKVTELEKLFKDKITPILNKYPDKQRSAILGDRNINFSSGPIRKKYNEATGEFE